MPGCEAFCKRPLEFRARCPFRLLVNRHCQKRVLWLSANFDVSAPLARKCFVLSLRSNLLSKLRTKQFSRQRRTYVQIGRQPQYSFWQCPFKGSQNGHRARNSISRWRNCSLDLAILPINKTQPPECPAIHFVPVVLPTSQPDNFFHGSTLGDIWNLHLMDGEQKTRPEFTS